MVHKAGLGPAELRFLAEDVFRLHHLCIWYAERDSNPQDPVPETGMSSFASSAYIGSEGNGAPVGHLPKAKVTRTSQPKRAMRALQASRAMIEVAVSDQ